MPQWTAKGLYQSTLSLSSTRANIKPSPDKQIEKIIPFAGTKIILFQLSMAGVTQKNVRHQVNVLFTGIDIKREPTDGYIKISDKTGDYWYSKPSANSSTIRYRCTCKDAYFTWLIWDFKQGAIFGDKPRPYKRLTPLPPKGYPYRNPDEIPGACKHFFNSIKHLQANKYIN